MAEIEVPSKITVVKPKRQSAGGWRFHKEGCKCSPCTAERAKQAGQPHTPWEEKSKAEQAAIASQHRKDGTHNYKDRSKKARVAEWAAIRMKEPGITTKAIAERMGINCDYLYRLIREAQTEGWLSIGDPVERIEFQIIPKALDNLNELLDAKNPRATLDTVKGTIFPQYRESKGITETHQTVLALKIEAPPAGAETQVITGQIVGTPRQLEE